MKQATGTFCTIFPAYKDYHFYKDPGQIPYRISKLGYESTLICYGDRKSLQETQKYLKIKCFPYLYRKFNIAIILYLFFRGKRIDVLNTFHLTWSSLLFVFIYKAVNRRGFAYLKLDNCAYLGVYPWEENIADTHSVSSGRTTFKGRLKNKIAGRFFLKKVDLWSIEDDYSRDHFKKKYEFFRGKLITIYNGHTSDLPGSPALCGFEEKEKIILTAGRLGTFQKATEVLLDAFRLVAEQSDFQLHLAGPVETSFRKYIEDYFSNDPSLKERVFFHGALGRDELYGLYCRSKIFCMSSRYEGMAIVFPEAMYYGNAIVTTWPVSVKELVEKNNLGITVEKDDRDALSGALLTLIGDDALRQGMAERAHEVATSLLNWDKIIHGLDIEIKTRKDFEKSKSHDSIN
jgi:glycosyltransferase involved in cell wall biosynthesis